MADPVAIGTAAGAALAAFYSAARQHVTRKNLAKDLELCKLHELRCTQKLSAIETELVTLRKLLPGGEWYTRLGLGDYPHPYDQEN